ncbi:MAG: protoporphyrinogen oxidase [Pyrinomonadaceae bacterium]|nr:protoporphyrinogen oxidase [Pyrinomonadaceae bacterium]
MQSEVKKSRRVVIIGGGISGLAAAHRLIERGAEDSAMALEVLLLERLSQVGGTIRTRKRDGFLLETGPDSFISEKPEVLELARRIGLVERLIQTNSEHRRSFIVRAGRLLPVPEGFQLLAPSRLWPFVTSGIFSWQGKARMALELFLPRRAVGGNGSSDESLAEFVRRRFGREALERMAQPMVGGIYTADPEKLSLKATMPRFLEMERKHRSLIWAMWNNRRKLTREESRGTSGARYSLFLSFDEGMQLLSDTLAARLPAGVIRLNTHVEAIRFDKEKREWHVKVAGEEEIRADAVCVALPAYAAGALLSEVDSQLASELEAIPYASTATINFGWRRADIPHPLDGFGFVVPFAERRTVLACTFTSVKFKGRAPEGHAVLRAFVGGALQPEMFALDEEEMTRRVLEDLRALLGIEKPPLFSVVEKWPRSMAQYMIGHLERVARIKQRVYALGTLQLIGNAYHGAGIPDCIRSGSRAADEIIKALR